MSPIYNDEEKTMHTDRDDVKMNEDDTEYESESEDEDDCSCKCRCRMPEHGREILDDMCKRDRCYLTSLIRVLSIHLNYGMGGVDCFAHEVYSEPFNECPETLVFREGLPPVCDVNRMCRYLAEIGVSASYLTDFDEWKKDGFVITLDKGAYTPPRRNPHEWTSFTAIEGREFVYDREDVRELDLDEDEDEDE